MKKNFAIFILISVVIMSPSVVFAGLVPCNDVCTLCDLIVGVHNIVEYLLRLVFAVALVILTIAGVIYIVSAGNPGTAEKAKSAIKNALAGVVITLLAWLIVNTIMNVLASGGGLGLAEGGWSTKFNCASTPAGGGAGSPITDPTSEPMLTK